MKMKVVLDFAPKLLHIIRLTINKSSITSNKAIFNSPISCNFAILATIVVLKKG